MAFSDWYELIDTQEVGAEQMINVYHVRRLAPSFEAADIAKAYADTVIPPLLAIQHETLEHSGITVRSLDDPLDFAALSILPNTGELLTPQIANFNAATIQFNRLRTDMKNGQKRFMAGAEDKAMGNSWGPAFIATIQLVGAAIVSQWIDDLFPGVPVCEFGILKRICSVDPPPDPCPSYRLPEDDEELVFYIPITFNVRDTIRTQNSRKRLV